MREGCLFRSTFIRIHHKSQLRRHVHHHRIQQGQRSHALHDGYGYGDDDRVVPFLDVNVYIFAFFVYGMLCQIYGGRRFDMRPDDGMVTIADAAQEPIISYLIKKHTFLKKGDAFFSKIWYVLIERYTLYCGMGCVRIKSNTKAGDTLMKLSLKQRFKNVLMRIGEKNRICLYIRGNRKRLAMTAMTFLLFMVYSSFTFPAFAAGNVTDNDLNPVFEEAQDIEPSEESEADYDETRHLEEDDIITENAGEYLGFHEDIGGFYGASEIPEDAGDRDAQGSGKTDIQEDVEFSKDDWRLILVNKQHSIPDDYQVTLGKISTLKGTMYCDERIIDDFLDMLKAAKEDNVKLEVTSPYRDTERQEYLFNRKIKAYMAKGLSYIEAYQLSSQAVTVPGASEHQVGLALDIVTPAYRKLTEGFADTDAGIWLAENSYKYGFILRYPKGKEYITGIEYEPWHFRYVGVEAATVITERGITLEEFWEEL